MYRSRKKNVNVGIYAILFQSEQDELCVHEYLCALLFNLGFKYPTLQHQIDKAYCFKNTFAPDPMWSRYIPGEKIQTEFNPYISPLSLCSLSLFTDIKISLVIFNADPHDRLIGDFSFAFYYCFEYDFEIFETRSLPQLKISCFLGRYSTQLFLESKMQIQLSPRCAVPCKESMYNAHIWVQ